MNKILILTALVLSGFFSSAQIQDWAYGRSGNGSTDEISNNIVIDANSNLIITGSFSSPTVTLSSLTLTNSGVTGTSEFLLAKYNAAGVIQWAKRAQGNGDDKGMSVTTDPTGNIYVAGNYESTTITFGTITLTNSASGFADVFVVKYDPSGNVLWAKSFGGTLLETVRSIKADNSGNTYITGSFSSLSVLFGGFGVVNAGNSDAFLVKIDVNGVPLWAKQIGGAQNENGLGTTHDGNGNIYILGEFNSSNLTTYNLTNAGGFDIFLAKYDASGNFISSKGIGGTLNETGNYILTDATGDIYIAGSFESASLNLGTLTLSNASTRDMLLLKVNNTFVTQWAKKASGNLASFPTGLFIDGSSNLYMTGQYNLSALNFGTASINNASSGIDGFVAKYNLSGTDLFAKGTASAGDEKSRGVVVDNLGSIYLTGSYNPSFNLGTSTLTAGGSDELFLVKICTVPATPTVVSNVTVCNKKKGVLNVLVPSGSVANWYSAATGGSLLLSGSNSYTAAMTSTFYVESYNSANGCSNPARVAISLSVQPGASVTVSGKTLTATSGTSFKWIECVKDSVLTNHTTQNYTVTQSGNYAVVVTNNSCIDTSACKFYSINIVTGTVTVPGDTIKDPTDTIKDPPPPPPVSVQKYLNNSSISVYPNPNDGNFTIRSSQPGKFDLYNVLGIKVRTIIIDNEYIVVHDLESGVYFISNESGRYRQRIIVSR